MRLPVPGGEHSPPVGPPPRGVCPLNTNAWEGPSSSFLPPLLPSTVCVSSFTRKEDKPPRTEHEAAHWKKAHNYFGSFLSDSPGRVSTCDVLFRIITHFSWFFLIFETDQVYLFFSIEPSCVYTCFQPADTEFSCDTLSHAPCPF